jgi:hypothetical protein
LDPSRAAPRGKPQVIIAARDKPSLAPFFPGLAQNAKLKLKMISRIFFHDLPPKYRLGRKTEGNNNSSSMAV